MTAHALQLVDIHKQFVRGSERIEVLRGVNLDVANGELLGLMGPSGSGKSTLLNLIAGLDRPTTGEVFVAGDRLSAMDESKIAKWRSSHIGFVFQFYHLIPVLTAFENVELPLLLFNMPGWKRRQQVQLTLELVGLKHRMHHRPGQMSGGEQQRVGIARALVTDPTLIVADEPTGDLDSKTSQEILDLIQAVHEDLGKTIIVVTHDPRAAARTERVVHMNKGVLQEGSREAIQLAASAFAH